MDWFRKSKPGLVSQEKKEIPDGLWTKCKGCGEVIYSRVLKESLWVCPSCNYHFRIDAAKIIELLLDDSRLEEHDADMASLDPLDFRDSKRYTERVLDSQEATGLKDAVICGIGAVESIPVSFALMDFSFMGGSMGSVVGEKVARAIERAIDRNIPLVVISCSGGARMQEGILSLMQMAKTSALLSVLTRKKLPYISILLNPTTAGVMASYASLGDVIIAEPKALLGFAGPRVIQQTIGQELPEGFQSSEFFLEHGFLDLISERKDLRRHLALCLKFTYCPPVAE
jgi:acetyl-CoA carboxylase carboxyl transferase subunit beta